jgi:hypothetical protein
MIDLARPTTWHRDETGAVDYNKVLNDVCPSSVILWQQIKKGLIRCARDMRREIAGETGARVDLIITLNTIYLSATDFDDANTAATYLVTAGEAHGLNVNWKGHVEQLDLDDGNDDWTTTLDIIG